MAALASRPGSEHAARWLTRDVAQELGERCSGSAAIAAAALAVAVTCAVDRVQFVALDRDVAQELDLDGEHRQERGDQLGPGPEEQALVAAGSGDGDQLGPGSRSAMLAVVASPARRAPLTARTCSRPAIAAEELVDVVLARQRTSSAASAWLLAEGGNLEASARRGCGGDGDGGGSCRARGASAGQQRGRSACRPGTANSATATRRRSPVPPLRAMIVRRPNARPTRSIAGLSDRPLRDAPSLSALPARACRARHRSCRGRPTDLVELGRDLAVSARRSAFEGSGAYGQRRA